MSTILQNKGTKLTTKHKLALFLLLNMMIFGVSASPTKSKHKKSIFKRGKTKKQKLKENSKFFEDKLTWCHKLIGNSIEETVGRDFILDKASAQPKIPIHHPF